MTQPQPPEFKVQVPDELAGGVYSNFIAVWHSPYEFTLDFAVMAPPEAVTDDDGNQRTVVPGRVVSRVRIPPAAVFELMQALSKNERLYEDRFGPIPRPGQSPGNEPLFPPEG